MKGGLKRLLILSITAGTGHMRAAEAVKEAVKKTNRQAEVTILDAFRYANPLLEKVILGTYIEILKMSPVIYSYLYRQAEWGQPLAGFAKAEFNKIINRLAASKLIDFIAETKPQIILCTHPFPVGIMENIKKKGFFHGPVLAAVTDFTVHPFWVFPGIDCYLVAADDLQKSLCEYGIKKDQVCVTGIPISYNFTRRWDKRKLRSIYGLNPDLPVALVMGGGLGMGSLETVVKALGNGQGKYQLIVVAGYNKTLKVKLERMIPILDNRMVVLGYVREIHKLMATADFLISKAGGLTCAEALASGLPIFIVNPLPGQEERNTEFLTSCGVAVKINKGIDLPGIIDEVLAEPERMEKMRESAFKLGRPQAAMNIVALMEKYLLRGQFGA